MPVRTGYKPASFSLPQADVMRRNAFNAIVAFWQDEQGQSITEYGAVLAFVGVLIALAFSLAKGGLFSAVSNSYSGVVNNLGALNSYSNNNGS
jgi:Flp pilus assembly pilin Flp